MKSSFPTGARILSSKFPRPQRIIKNITFEESRVTIGESSAAQNPQADAETEFQARLKAQERELQQRSQAAEKEAEKIMQEARSESIRLINEAQERMKEIEKQAFQQGFQQGENEGKKQLQEALSHFQNVIQAGLQARSEILHQSEGEIIELVLEIVRRILKIEPLINEQALIRVTQNALERLSQRVDVRIFVHPEDVDLLHFSLSQLENLALEIVIEPDDSMSPGGCRIQSQAGEIDATLDHQFKVIAQSFLALAEGDAVPLEQE